MKFNLLFEMNSNNGYVGVLSNSHIVKGSIASQNAGSSNTGIYYQVGGLGVNGYFHTALGTALSPSVNQELVSVYDTRFGAGAWAADSSGGRGDRLTSFYIPIPPNSGGHSVGSRAVGMVYSVGPILSSGTVTDRDQYRQVYIDALSSVAAANQGASGSAKVEALRITMLSTGLYGPPPGDTATALARDVATIILEAIAAAVKLPNASELPTTILINSSIDTKKDPDSKEIDAFTLAAQGLGITASSSGFTYDTGN